MTTSESFSGCTTDNTYCPHCCALLDGYAVTSTEGRQYPRENDATICAYCFNFSFFRADLTLRAPTNKEQAELESDIKGQMLLKAIKKKCEA